ncbi:MAG: ribonuclease HII [Candidatus Thorarchaeota archaeon]
MYDTCQVAGIDEAGRGPIIGPIMVCGVLLSPSRIEVLKRIGVRDSKELSPRRRTELSFLIYELADEVLVEEIKASQIDLSREQGVSLNELERIAFASIVRRLQPSVVYVDAIGNDPSRFGERIAQEAGVCGQNCQIISEYKADTRYTVVSAASVVAKVRRDLAVAEIRRRYGDFGSGYPSDPKTTDFVRSIIVEHGRLPSFVRRTWQSVNTLIRELDGRASTIQSFG